MAIKIRRGTDTARLAVIFEEGEVIYTTDTKSFFIGDGVTAGGNQIGGTTAASLLKAEVHNATGVTLTKGQVVYLNGNTGNKPNAVLAQANSEATSSKTIGLIILNISNNASGYIATDGLLSDLNTSAFVAGDLLWLSDSIAGGLTTIIPDTPNHAVFIGYVVRAHATLGSILIHIQNGYELNEIHDVKITSVQNNDGLIYDNSLGYWKNSNTVTVQGNTFNAANKLVQLDGTAKLPAIDGSQLTNLPTPTTPTLATVTTAGNTTTNAITVGGLTVDTNTLFVDATNNKVGIGTLVPFDTLNVSGSSAPGISITSTTFTQSSAGRASLSLLRLNTATNAFIGWDLLKDVNDTLAIRYLNSSSAAQENVRLWTNGNVTIQSGGTFTDAGYKLDVNGSTRVKGAGATSATTALLVQNSVSTSMLNLRDDNVQIFGSWLTFESNRYIYKSQNTTSILTLCNDGSVGAFLNLYGSSHATLANVLDFGTASTNRLRITGATGNVLINTTTDAGYKLDVNGTARFQGNVDIKNPAGATIITLGGFNELPEIRFINANISISNAASAAILMQTSSGNITNHFAVIGKSNLPNTSTTGTPNGIVATIGFAPTSGTASFTLLNLSNTINQTGGANGITRGLYVNPTLTAAADFRAIDVEIGTIVLGRMTSDPSTAINGMIYYNTTNNKFRGYENGSWQNII